VAALHSITAAVHHQQQVDSVLLFLQRHGQYVDSIDVTYCGDNEEAAVTIRQLLSNLQLTSLRFEWFCLQQQPGNGFQGVLGASPARRCSSGAAAGLPLKQLQLIDCKLLDGQKGLADTLAVLPSLEHLIIDACVDNSGHPVPLPTGILQRVQQLTYLELAGVSLRYNRKAASMNILQPLQGMIRLRELLITRCSTPGGSITADILSGMCFLTRLVASHISVGPGA
jgi:hypothetical protein